MRGRKEWSWNTLQKRASKSTDAREYGIHVQSTLFFCSGKLDSEQDVIQFRTSIFELNREEVTPLAHPKQVSDHFSPPRTVDSCSG